MNPNPDSPPGTYLTIRNPTATADGFATAVSGLGNNMVAVGAPRADNGGISSGAVYVYNADTGKMIRKLQHHDPQDKDMFGASIAPVGDDKMLVASVGKSVHLYDTASGARLLDIQDPVAARHGFPMFGFQMGLLDNGNLVVSDSTERNGSYRGAVYVFDQQGNQVLRILNPDPDPPRNTSFGRVMSTMQNDIFALAYSYSEGHNKIYRFNGLTGVLLDTKTSPISSAARYFGWYMDADPSAGLLTSDRGASSSTGRGYLYGTDGTLREMRPYFPNHSGVGLGTGVALTSDNVVLGSSHGYYLSERYGGLYVFDKDYLSRAFAYIPNPALHSTTFGYETHAIGDNKVIINSIQARVHGTDIQGGEAYLANTGSRDPLPEVSPSSATGVSPSSDARAPARPLPAASPGAAQSDGAGAGAPPPAPRAPRVPVLLGFDLDGSQPERLKASPDAARAFIALRFDAEVENLPVFPWDFDVSYGGEPAAVIDAAPSGSTVVLAVDRASLYLDGAAAPAPDLEKLEVHVLAPWAAVPTDASAEGAVVEITGAEARDRGILLRWNMFGDEADYKVVISPSADRGARFADTVAGAVSYAFVNLEPDTEYEVRVGVRGDDSTQSALDVRTRPAGQSALRADLILGVTLSQPGGSVAVSWIDANDMGDGRYRVERSVDGGPFAEIERQPGSRTDAADSARPEWSGKQVSYRVFEWVGKQKLYSDEVSFVLQPS